MDEKKIEKTETKDEPKNQRLGGQGIIVDGEVFPIPMTEDEFDSYMKSFKTKDISRD